MPDDLAPVVEALNRRFLLDYPRRAAHWFENTPARSACNILKDYPLEVSLPVWESLAPGAGEALLALLPDDDARALLRALDPGRAAVLLAGLESGEQERLLGLLTEGTAEELRKLMAFPPNSAGALMDTRVRAFRGSVTVKSAIQQLRALLPRTLRHVFLVDEANRLSSVLDVQELMFAEPGQPLAELSRPVRAAVTALDPREDVVDKFERLDLDELPVVNIDGELLGVIRHAALVDALREETSVDIQTMVGASKDERALSSSLFAVRKRLPWLHINLLTAFLAAAVVGLFEDTIARFTALAVLLPVVAGQSGNAGAQALAVTMRGLALREITIRHWLEVTAKEVSTGFLNGVAIALTTGTGVWIWSGSFGLALVIAMSMVLSMVAAGLAGAMVPITLTRLGQDPAQSSSIILTTVTDIAGFFSFLGIATALAGMLSG